jgi:hypothetical protein
MGEVVHVYDAAYGYFFSSGQDGGTGPPMSVDDLELSPTERGETAEGGGAPYDDLFEAHLIA